MNFMYMIQWKIHVILFQMIIERTTKKVMAEKNRTDKVFPTTAMLPSVVKTTTPIKKYNRFKAAVKSNHAKVEI